MTALLSALALFLAIITLIQFCYVRLFERGLNGSRDRRSDESSWPKATVVLCVRGNDPSLSSCIDSLMNQQYPEYQVKVIVDHPEDPAWQTLRKFESAESKASKLDIELLSDRRSDCSLKCSSLIQAATGIDADTEFIALLDADTVPDQHWLENIASGLAPESVGAVTGLRWFAPIHENPGSLTRHIWNSAAIVQMYCYSIAWGGTLAIKTSALRSSGLLSLWGKSFCEDTMISKELKKIGQRLHVEPSLVSANMESCQLSSCLAWMVRQLLAARLYHEKWWLVVVHAFGTTLPLIIAILATITAFVIGQYLAAGWGILILFFYQLANLYLLKRIERTARAASNREQTPSDKKSSLSLLTYLLMLPITQAAYFVAIMKALSLRNVCWRQVKYRIRGPWQIELTHYAVYEQSMIEVGSDSL